MKKIVIIAVVLITTVFSSCETELFEDSNSQKISADLSLKDGRMVFQSKEALVRVYKQYAEASDEKLSKFLEPMYKNGFYSLRPIVTESNEVFLFEHYKEKIRNNDYSKTTEEDSFDYLDDIEDIIGDDAFAAFLNSDAEIQVADEIYKYTDVGLFFTKEIKLDIMEEYLISKNISLDLRVETTLPVKQAILAEFPSDYIDGVTVINEDISYFKIPPPDDCYISEGIPCGGGSGGARSGVYNNTNSDPSYLSFLSYLGNCSPDSGLFGNLFGDNNVCIDKYEDRRRVKTKAFNYNYLLVYHMGVKCVHQYKGWTGFWRVEATDEIRLVVEAAQFQYDLDVMLGNNQVTDVMRQAHFFMNNQKITFSPNYTMPNPTMTLPNLGAASTTYFDASSLSPIFQNDGMGLTFEFYQTGWDVLDNGIQNGIDSNLNASKLNNLFYNNLYTLVTSSLRSAQNNSSYTPPANRTAVFRFPQTGKLIIQKSVLDQGFNIGVRKRTFDWGGEIRVNASESASGTWSVSSVGAGNQLARPSNFRVKIIGAARRGGTWHGSKFSIGID
ncbi:hypothetical protein [Flavobacterium sp.]|uniref:hypothetical protein n=1 Tax=Flavobacterium sp. TaxID=239 RepID=UPI00374D3C22